MGRATTAVEPAIERFITAQPVFFVATAPLAGDGHVNCSPKGLDALVVVDPRRVMFLDLHGSGAETIAHLEENGRIVLMFCAFEGPPRIVRVHGRGRVARLGTAEFAAHIDRFTTRDGARSIVIVDVERVATSCGYGVPLMRFEGHRDQLPAWSARKGEAGLAAYRAEKNARSIDGLPGF